MHVFNQAKKSDPLSEINKVIKLVLWDVYERHETGQKVKDKLLLFLRNLSYVDYIYKQKSINKPEMFLLGL